MGGYGRVISRAGLNSRITSKAFGLPIFFCTVYYLIWKIQINTEFSTVMDKKVTAGHLFLFTNQFLVEFQRALMIIVSTIVQIQVMHSKSDVSGPDPFSMLNRANNM